MPPLSITQTPGARGEIETLTARSGRGLVLENGTDCIVMRVSGMPVELLIAAYSRGTQAVVPALKVDRIALDVAAAPAANAVEAPQKKLVIKDKGISLVGHVELVGDTVAGDGEVLGNPASAHRIEGFQIMWPDRPEGVDLAYNVVVEGVGATPVVKTGQFTGTRREAKRITEVTLALIGPNASKYHLAGTAHFSGGFQIPLSSGVALSGPSGMEHLTGLGLRVASAVPAAASAARGAKKVTSLWEESPRTKVFSAKGATSKKQSVVAKKPSTKTAKAAPKKRA